MEGNPYRTLVVATLIVAVLSAFLVEGAWLIWMPMILALAGVAYLNRVTGQRRV